MVHRTKIIWFIVIALFLVISTFAAVYLFQGQSEPETKSNELIINDTTFEIERALTQEERVQGLSGRDSIDKGNGLLFDFYEEGDWGIWMKDMKFSIDMIWLDGHSVITDIEQNVSPDTYPQTFCPDKPARYVVEVNAGIASQAKLSIGQRLWF